MNRLIVRPLLGLTFSFLRQIESQGFRLNILMECE